MPYTLYDGQSPITWRSGIMTRDEMDGDLHYPPSDQPCVLFDNGEFVYDWRYLKAMCEQNGIEFVEGLADYQSLLGSVIEAMNKPKPTLQSVAQDTEMNTEAIAELGSIVSDNAQASNDLMEASAELGVMYTDNQVSINDLMEAVAESWDYSCGVRLFRSVSVSVKP